MTRRGRTDEEEGQGRDDAAGFQRHAGGVRSGDAADIQQKEFRVSRVRGYRMRDVDEFLDQITESMTEARRRERAACGPRRAARRARRSARPISRTRPARPTRSSSEPATRPPRSSQDARAQAAAAAGAGVADGCRARRGRAVPRAGAGVPPAARRPGPGSRRVGEGDGEGQPDEAGRRCAPSAPDRRRHPAAAPDHRERGGEEPSTAGRRRPTRRSRARRCDHRAASPESVGAGRRRRRSAWKSRPPRRSAPATRTTTPDRARAATGRSGSCSGARSDRGRSPYGRSPSVRRRVRPDPRRGGRPRAGLLGRRRPRVFRPSRSSRAAAGCSAVARRRQALGLEALRRLIATGSPSIVDLVPERVAVERAVVERRRRASHPRRSRGTRRAPRRRRPVADTPSAIRSLTSRPAALRASWTARTSSRASPSRRRSSVSSRSSATVTPPSHATPQPSLTSCARSTSSGVSAIGRAVVDRERHLVAARERRRDGAVVGARTRRDVLDARTEPRPEHLEVGLGAPSPERLVRLGEDDPLHVELVGHERRGPRRARRDRPRSARRPPTAAGASSSSSRRGSRRPSSTIARAAAIASSSRGRPRRRRRPGSRTGARSRARRPTRGEVPPQHVGDERA